VAYLENPWHDPSGVPAPSPAALGFHRALPGYAPTPVRELSQSGVRLKDESNRLGLPAFKILGASWAVERELASSAGVEVLVAASAGNHGRAVARAAALRGLAARIYLPSRAAAAAGAAIGEEGADVVIVDGSYEDAVAQARLAAAREPGAIEIADVGDSTAAHAVIDGYATLFAELADQTPVGTLIVPVGVGSLAAAAARFGASVGVTVIGVEPATAACLTASLAAGEPTPVPTPGTVMRGMDCAEVSPAAWPSLRAGIAATVTVADAELPAADAKLRAVDLELGECAVATVAALEHLPETPPDTVLVATEGITVTPPVA
jgi:diaminopropionate ammonia-lyase